MLTLRQRSVALPEAGVGPSSRRRMLLAGPAVAIASMVAAILATSSVGLPLRDPDHVAGRRLLLIVVLVLVLVGIDVAWRAAKASAQRWPTREELGAVRRERWTRARSSAVGIALLSFYVSYLAYRNFKSVVPLMRPDSLFDAQLDRLDRLVFAGHEPAAVLHSLLGTGFATHALSDTYMLFFAFIPGTLALALVFSPNLQAGLFYATAQSMNWLLGAVSYLLVPSLGPVYAHPENFARLPSTGAGHLQQLLLDQRLDFLRDPVDGAAQSIAAFASLHVSIYFTAAVAAHVLGLGRRVRVTAWALLALTVLATIHLGWHYLMDDLGGVVVGLLALAAARGLTGYRRAAQAPATALAAA